MHIVNFEEGGWIHNPFRYFSIKKSVKEYVEHPYH